MSDKAKRPSGCGEHVIVLLLLLLEPPNNSQYAASPSTDGNACHRLPLSAETGNSVNLSKNVACTFEKRASGPGNGEPAAPGTAWGAISPDRGGDGERRPPGAGGLARSLLRRESRPCVGFRRPQLVFDGARQLAPTPCVWCACVPAGRVREGQGVRLARLACCSARGVRRARRLGCRQCSVPSLASASL